MYFLFKYFNKIKKKILEEKIIQGGQKNYSKKFKQFKL